MPPKQRFTSDDIIEAAFNVVRQNGWKGLSARAIAKELNSSTRPIYSYLDSMENLEEKLVKKAMDLFYEYMTTERTGDIWLDQALGYFKFAKEEKHLFRGVFEEKYLPLTMENTPEIWSAFGEQLADYDAFQGLSEEQIGAIRVARWFFIHGLSCLVNSKWFSIEDETRIVMENREEKNTIDVESLLRTADSSLCEGFKNFADRTDPD
ncbi:MAG: TetR/AcrR family transcriptional regulator [Desulfobacterales bacterium]|nr:TetR/AcrR family transcriptional regulator [Desulfobacterales bacterium]